MKEIMLTQGKVALVDDEDYEMVNQYKWYAGKYTKTYYAQREVSGITQKMHRIILNASKGIEVDHEDHDGLNNQRYNIRLGSKNQNGKNKQKQLTWGGKLPSSKYKGVIWRKDRKTRQWQVRIMVDRKMIHLGFFDDEIEAALAYDQAAKIHHGEFAKLNFVGG